MNDIILKMYIVVTGRRLIFTATAAFWALWDWICNYGEWSMFGPWDSDFIEPFSEICPHVDLERLSMGNILNVNEYRQRCICGSP